MLKSFSADIIFPVSGPPVRNGFITVNEEGFITEIGQGNKTAEHYHGAICPGFVNTHCHLELSFMFKQIPEQTGLIDFVKQVVAIRNNFSENELKRAVAKASKEMQESGIVAIGDISNDDRSFFEKAKGNIRLHTFVEAFDLGPDGTANAMQVAKDVYEKVPKVYNSSASITPHAPYSCTPELYRLCDSFTAQNGHILSIHNQENPYENQHFMDGESPWKKLFADWGTDGNWYKPYGQSSLQAMSAQLSGKNKMLFIHNTFTSEEDFHWAHSYFDDVYWCTCPNANKYIEQTLPNYDLWRKCGAEITVGTDSLASNWQLNILEELKTIKSGYAHIPTTELLLWTTLNGARALNFDKELGSLEVGKKPGLVLLEHLNSEFEITESSVSKNLTG